MMTTKSISSVISTGPYSSYKKWGRLISILGKLDIKSAQKLKTAYFPNPLQVESLDVTLKNITFDDKDLKAWSKIPQQ